jgi:transposase
MYNATFNAPCLTTFCRLGSLGLEAVGQSLETDHAVIEGGVKASKQQPVG